MGNRSCRLFALSLALVSLSVVSRLSADCIWTGTPTVLTTVNCNVGIGTTTPGFPLEIVKSGGNIQFSGSAYSSTGGAVNFLGRGARGTEGAPAGTMSGDILMLMGGRGYVGGSGFSAGSTSRITFRAANDLTPTSQGGVITFDTVDRTDTSVVLTERMRIASDGVLLIGRTSRTTPPPTGLNNVKLDVNGDIVVGGNINGKYQDVAEWVPAAEPLPAGTVVVLNRAKVNEVMASTRAYDTAVAGVVTEQPGIVLGEPGPSKERIATTGRIKVRADATKHAIHVGDLLVTSDSTGAAMRSDPIEVRGRSFHQPGTIIGKALEPLDHGQGEILVLLSLQ